MWNAVKRVPLRGWSRLTAFVASQRPHRWRWLAGAIVFLLAYPVLGTLALWTGAIERLLASEDLRIEIENPAYTIWPGKVHLKRVRVLVNGETQFILSGDDLTANIEILPLFRKRFEVVQLEADNVRYKMRVQVDHPEAIRERIAAYPPLDDLPGEQTVSEEKAEKTEERGGTWTVAVDGIDAAVSELWFLEYHYVGDGRIRGGFERGPDVLRVGTSVQDLGPGELRFGADQVIAKKFRGRVEATIPEVNPEQHADVGFLKLVTANIELKADVASLAHVGAYFDGIDVRQGAGPFHANIVLDEGYVADQSQLGYSTQKLRVLGDGYAVETDWALDIEVTTPPQASPVEQKARVGASEPHADSAKAAVPEHRERPHLLSKAKSTYVSFTRPGGSPFTVQIHDHAQSLTLDSSQIDEATDLDSAELRFPTIITKDIDDLDGLAKKGAGWQSEAGTAQASLNLDMGQDKVLRGPLEMAFDGAKLIVAGVRTGGSGKLQTEIALDPRTEHLTLQDVSLHIVDAHMYVGDEDVDNWWMHLSTPRLSSAGFPPTSLTTRLKVVAKDAEPILEALAEKDKAPDLVAKFTSLDDLRIDATIRKDGDVLDVMVGGLESEVWDISGRFYRRGRRSQMAFLVGGAAVAVGIAKTGEDTEIRPLVDEDWLNERLEQFPEPIEQVRGDKP